VKNIVRQEMQEVSMNRFNKFLAVTLLSADVLLTSAAQAMTIQQFDKMADADQDEYVADLVVGAQKVLNDEGRPDLAKKARVLFTTINPGSQIPLGMGEFEENLARQRVADLKNVQKDPNSQRIEIEDVMVLTMHENRIEVPDSFFTVNKDFKPKHAQDKKN
jgi:hypothetical protein